MTRVIIFGDSITWGANDIEKGGWVNRLREYFDHELRDISIYNCGISGDDSSDLLFRFDVEVKARFREKENKNIVIFAIGINDTQNINHKGNYRISLDDYKKNMGILIDKSKKIFDEIIILGLTNVDETKTVPIPWSKDKSYYNSDAKKYNEALKNLVNEKKLKFVDVFDLVSFDEMKDGLHPDSSGHEKIFNKVKDALETN